AGVLVLDDLSSGRAENLHALAGRARFRLVEGSITDRELLAELADEATHVAHLAARVGVRRGLDQPTDALRTNLAGTLAVLESALAARRPVFYASSSEVYGSSGRVPYREDDPLELATPRNGRAGYAASKLAGEALALALHAEHGLPVAVGRLFN